MASEFAFIDWITKQSPAKHESLLQGIGDDCAVLQPFSNPMLVTTDMLMEGSCFILDEAGPYRVGRKAMAVNLSDIAAMAGKPIAAFVSLGIPRNMTMESLRELHHGMQSMAEEFGAVIAGGDTNSWEGPLTISVTLIGEAGPKGAILRSTAEVGDVVFVTGKLGGSILGHHLDFTPRVHLATWLSTHADLHSMIDISDGLSKDLCRILDASNVGVELMAEAIPISDAAVQCHRRDGISALEHALGDGEDFELIFTVSDADAAKLRIRAQSESQTIYEIGKIVENGRWLWHNGQKEPLPVKGYEHQFGRP